MANRRAFNLMAMALVAAAVWVVYGRALDAPFIFDDLFGIIENPSITRLWPPLGDAQHPGPLNPTKDLPTAGRPLVNLSLAINYYFGQLNPVGYHVFNLVVHVLSAWLLMAIVQHTLCLDYFQGRFQRASGPLALVVALLWTLHPLQTEAVVYVTQRTELMVGFFYLATLYCSLRYWAASSAASRGTWLALATLACLSGAASKEVIVTAPVIVLLFERTFIRRSFRQALRESWRLYLGLFLSWGLLLLFNYNAPRSESAGFHLGLPAHAWWFTQTKVLALYLKLVVWPWPLVIHYEMPYLATPAAAWPWLLPIALLAMVTLVLLWRSSAIGFVGAWVFIILSPTLVVPILTEVAAERRMYLPLAALVAAVVVAGYAVACEIGQRLSDNAGRSSIARWPVVVAGTASAVLILVLSLVSVRRLDMYHDRVKIWEDAAIYEPDDPIVHTNLGYVLTKEGRFDEAIQHCEQALRINPRIIAAHNNLGDALFKEHRLQEAIAHYHQALQIDPQCALSYNNLGSALVSSGQLSEAIEHYRLALALNPHYAEAHNNLGLALEQAGQAHEAIEHFQEALRLDPAYSEAHFDLGHALMNTGRFQEGIDEYQKALKFNPDYAEAYYNLGLAFSQADQIQPAIQNFRQAVRLKPSYAEAHQNLGNVLLNADQAPEAIEQLQLAIELRPESPEAHNSLGVALARSGRLQDAISQYAQALKLKPEYCSAHTNLADALAANVQLSESIEHFQQAVRLEPQRIEAWIGMASAYSQMNQSQEATAAAQKALDLARSQGQTAWAEQIEKWLSAHGGRTKQD